MSINSTITAESLAETMRTSLSKNERLRLGVRLSSTIAGGGLLIVGYVYGRLYPDQILVASLVTLAAALTVGVPIFAEALKGFLSKVPGKFTEQLVSLAVIAAIAKADFVTATLVPLFIAIGHFLEERSVLGAQAAIDRIREMHARKANLLDGDIERQVSPEELKPGDRIIVRPGEVIPADGSVVEGRSSVDQAPVTGESMYEDVAPGSPVFAGTVNLNGLLRIEVTGVGNETALGRVLELLQEAESSKAPASKLIERYAAYYLPLVLTLAAVVLFFTADTTRAITVLVVACPCAFVLSSPTAMIAALAVASRLSILIKNTGFLEKVSEIDTLLLDKTGTVTLGQLAVTGFHPVEGVTEEQLLKTAARCGYGSLHPVAKAVVDEARSRGIELETASQTIEDAGLGLTADTDEGTIRLGRLEWLKEIGIECGHEVQTDGTVVYVARDSQVLGVIEMEDRPRPEARQALDSVRNLGVDRLVLLTGDKEKVAKKVADELGFDEYVAEILPEQKLQLVEKEREAGRRVMVVGDGVNDALALAGADVGVALGAMMNEVALGSADIALMTNNLNRLPQMMRLSSVTRATINTNILFGAGFSIIMLALASFGFINPLIGALLHNGG
ncbi:heavy metal translocating P-type ATPase, partial [bacterium]